nr:PREDICTED: L-selectin-like [Lepisosteus oculatus]
MAGEPNNLRGKEDCVEMSGGGTWNDAPCGQQKNFVCYQDTQRALPDRVHGEHQPALEGAVGWAGFPPGGGQPRRRARRKRRRVVGLQRQLSSSLMDITT